MMGTSGITNLVNDLNLLNVDIPKNSDSSAGEFAKTFENVSQNGDIDIKPKDINVVDELKTSDSVKDNYLKETNGKKFENKVEAQGDKAVSKTNSVSSDSKTKLNNADSVEEVTDEAVENVINAYCEAFGISVDDFKAFLEENNISVSDLFDVSKVQPIVMQLNGITDSVDILTDDALFDSIKNLEALTEENINALADELNVDVNELKDVIENTVSDKISEAENAGEAVERPDAFEAGVKTEIVDHKVVETNEKIDTNEETSADNKTETLEIKGNDTKNQTEKKSNENEGNNSYGNNVSSNDTQVQNNLQINSEETISYSDRAQEIYDQIGEQIRNLSRDNINEIELKLQPETLGTLHVRVIQSEGAMKAEFVTNNENVKAIIEGQLIQLKQDFEESGIKVNEVEVKVSTNEFNENTQQDSRDEENERAARPVATRRINISDGIELDEIDEYEDEEKIAVEMMAANGNSMDYRA
jgi:flagellar hook-length control protein FliK